MPELDGLQATREIRRREAARNQLHTPVIALTAGITAKERSACRMAGMDEVLTKPLELGRLRELLERIAQNLPHTPVKRDDARRNQ
jgi:CheY-like chemotaxis protein